MNGVKSWSEGVSRLRTFTLGILSLSNNLWKYVGLSISLSLTIFNFGRVIFSSDHSIPPFVPNLGPE